MAQTARVLLALFSLGAFFSHAQAEPGISSTEIKIGTSIDLTASIKEIGNAFVDGSTVVFDAVNKSGGIHGRKIKWVVFNDSYKPETALANVKKLVDQENVFLLYGNSGTALIKASMPTMEKAKVPLILPATGSDYVRRPHRSLVFTLRVDYQQEAEHLTGFLVKKRGIKEIGVIHQDDGFGVSGVTGIAKALADNGLKLHSQAKYPRLTTDVTAAVATIQKAKPKAVFLQTTPEAGLEIVKRLRTQEYKPIFISSSILGALYVRDTIKEAGDDFYVTDALPLLTPEKYPVVKEYIDAIGARGKPVHPFGLEGYLSAKILVEALKRAGPKPTRAALVNALETLKEYDLGGIKITYTPTEHQALKAPYLYHFKDGKMTLL